MNGPKNRLNGAPAWQHGLKPRHDDSAARQRPHRPPPRTGGRGPEPHDLATILTTLSLDLPPDFAGAGAPALRVRPREPLAAPGWDAFAAAHPRARVWPLSAGARVFGEAYGYAPACLALEDGDRQLRGVMPLLYRARPLSGRRCVSLPAVPGGGPLAETP